MRHYYWLSSESSPPHPHQNSITEAFDRSQHPSKNPGRHLSEYTTDSPSHPPHSTLIPVSAVLENYRLATYMSEHSSYQDIANFFDASPGAISILITDSSAAELHPVIAMISRHRFTRWQASRGDWETAQHRPLSNVLNWWQEARHFLLIDHHTPLQDVITLILERPEPETYEPLVIQSAQGAQVADISQLLTTYIRLARSEHAALADPEIANLRRQHQLILNAVGEGVYGVDLQGNATFVNPAAARMTGWDARDLIGRSMHQVLHHSHLDHSPYPQEKCPIYAAFQDGIIHRVSEEVFWRKDGTHFPVEYISTPMRDEQDKLIGAVVAFRDITQRKWAESILHRTNEELEQRVQERTAELRQVNDQLKELSELRSRVVTMVCHEFRNPLNNILLSVSSMGRYDHQLTLAQKEKYLLGIQDNVERMTQMIDAILLIGRVEAKRIEVQPSQFDAVSFCRDLALEMQLEQATERIQFISRAKRMVVTLDQQLLRSILTNILTNSLRYSAESAPIQFKLFRRNHYVIFDVQDQGIGIPDEDLPALFEPFHRGRNVSNISGTGLGLNIVKRFVDLQQGKIEVKSKLNAGARFTVRLPQCDLLNMNNA